MAKRIGPHDRAGMPAGPIDSSEHDLDDWERRADALSYLLGRRGIRNTDESRRTMEGMSNEHYESAKYYERWLYSVEHLLVEKGILSKEEIDQRMQELDGRFGV